MSAPYRLCLILTRELCLLDPLLVAKEAVAGGADMIQVREKDCSAVELLKWSRQVVELGQQLKVPVLINDSVEVAMASEASGVHLGQEDMSVADARQLLGKNKLIGLSTHDLEQLDDAALSEADYAGFGPIFPTKTKGYTEGLGAETLTTAALLTQVPLLAIGGITVENAWMVPGKAGIAVSSAICSNKEPQKTAHALLARCVY
jgi:thiamine-phosphate pyrophosphorylase